METSRTGQKNFIRRVFMKASQKIITAALAAALGASLTGCAKKADSQGDLLQRIQAKGEIVIATEGDWAPWTYHDEQDRLVGFDIEVAQKIAEKLGVEARFAETAWDGIFAGLDSGRYDIAANGVEITDERAQKYDFSEPYGYIHTALIVRSDDSKIKTFEDLKGKTSTNSLGSTYAAIGEQYGARVITIDSFDETLELVKFGRADATLNADVSFYDYMNVHPDAPFKVAALTQDASLVAVPLRKGKATESLRAAIDSAISELKEDGTIGAISLKYFGQDISR